MALWQRPVRVALASFAVTFGITLLYSMADRTAAPAAPPAAPTDPRAVIASRGARITLGDGSVIVADRQFAYDDGSARLVGVEVVVPAGEDRTDFRIRGGEAAGVEETGEWRLSGTVTIETGDGLTGSTSEAVYSDATGVVTMPAPAAFEQGWMRLVGDAARYDRRRGLVHLDRRAVVELQLGTGGSPVVRIAAGDAEVDRLAGVMRFSDAVTVDAGERRMQSDAVVVRFGADDSRLDALELTGSARMLGRDAEGGDLREMSAERIGIAYRNGDLGRTVLTGGARILGGGTRPGQLRNLSAPDIEVDYRTGAPERATLRGGARVELFGDRDGAPGVTIAGGSMDVALPSGGAAVEELHARERVTLEFPAHEGTARRIRAQTLEIGSDASEANQTAAEATAPSTPPTGSAATGSGQVAVFDGSVELRESEAPPASASEQRVMRADHMEAELSAGLGELTRTRFSGNVTLESGRIRAEADEASYAPGDALFTLLASDATVQSPRLNDQRGFLQAETIAIALDGPDIEAIGDVKGVLASAEADGSTTAVRPGLFAAGPPIHVAAGRFVYAAAESLATYSDGARLWQGSTEFRGQTIAIDETTGDISAEGSVQTRTTMLQNDDETADAVETTTEGRAETLFFDNQGRQASYTTNALLSSPGFSLGSEAIELFLQDDARTLARIEADGDVVLDLDTRNVTGGTLAYDDREGRYDLTGEPVRVTEEMEQGCRETTGRTVTFYANGQSISADGQSAERTFSTSGSCF